LETYKKLHGDCYVPSGYNTTINTSYPEEMRGRNILYKYVNCIRTGHIYQGEECRRELEAIGFDYHKKTGDFALLQEALLVYKASYGDLLVPYEYKIAEDDIRYPEQMRGRALGNIVHMIRTSNHYKEHKEELLAIGFNYQLQVGRFEEVKAALLIYKQIYGNLLVPREFVVPTYDTRYLEEVRGMRLGKTVSSIRSYACYKDHKEELLAMGFDFKKRVGEFEGVKEAMLAQ